ncbi:hypothetical protein AVEN_273866-1 [Araneus ventricosus]|uniref:Uncharacterized protein n=1 Tax=Araneus ventricosus TaxID=182803 RepID=A0A4Y2VR85_ARAVE|nr:hypothetical protein AVEN_273866-1 [Araneus ventricosus]
MALLLYRVTSVAMLHIFGYFPAPRSFVIHACLLTRTLSKVEKFNYLRSYLSANALSVIEGFSISDENYDSVVEILKNRFGRRDIIIHAHMNKLLNLAPVHRSDDIVKLRHLYDTLEIQVRSLKSLDVKPEAYSPMLISVLLPPEITLEFNRRNGDYSANHNIEKLLEFIRTKLECRERNALFSISGSKSRFNLQQPLCIVIP